MTDPFEVSRRKIALAKERIADLERQAEVFWQTNERSVIVEPNPDDPDEEIHKLKFAKPIPAHFADLAADALYNLRSCLDDAVYAVAAVTGKIGPRYATFPFGPNAVAFENRIKTRCKDIPKGLYPLFRAYQPYRGGDYALWELNEISITDKHKLLGVGLLAHFPGGVPSLIIEAPWDGLTNEFIFGDYIPGAGAAGKADDKLGYSPFVAFDNVPDRFLGQPVQKALAIFLDAVERFLLDLETESRRLGYIL